MLNREQRRMIMDLFSDGMGVSEIARKVGVSRQSVYRVIQSDFEEDTEIHALKKRLRKAELHEKIRKVEKPLRTKDELSTMNSAIDGLFSWVLSLWCLYHKSDDQTPLCLYCGEELEYLERREGEKVFLGYRCNRCRKVFGFP